MQRMNDCECAVLSPCFFFLALQISQQKSIELSHDLHSVSLDALTLDYPVSNLGSVGDHQRSLDLTAGTTLAPWNQYIGGQRVSWSSSVFPVETTWKKQMLVLNNVYTLINSLVTVHGSFASSNFCCWLFQNVLIFWNSTRTAHLCLWTCKIMGAHKQSPDLIADSESAVLRCHGMNWNHPILFDALWSTEVWRSKLCVCQKHGLLLLLLV